MKPLKIDTTIARKQPTRLKTFQKRKKTTKQKKFKILLIKVQKNKLTLKQKYRPIKQFNHTFFIL